MDTATRVATTTQKNAYNVAKPAIDIARKGVAAGLRGAENTLESPVTWITGLETSFEAGGPAGAAAFAAGGVLCLAVCDLAADWIEPDAPKHIDPDIQRKADAAVHIARHYSGHHDDKAANRIAHHMATAVVANVGQTVRDAKQVTPPAHTETIATTSRPTSRNKTSRGSTSRGTKTSKGKGSSKGSKPSRRHRNSKPATDETFLL